MNILDTLRNQKNTPTSKRMMIFFMALILAIRTISILRVGSVANVWLMLIGHIISSVLWLFLALKFENDGKSFVAHFMCFAFFVPDDLKVLLSIFTFEGALDLFNVLSIFVCGLIAIYLLLKMFVHKDEITFSKPFVKSNVLRYFTVVLVYSYFEFSSIALSLLIVISILMTTKSKDVLLFIMTLFLTHIVTYVVGIDILRYGDLYDMVAYFIKIIISGIIIYFGYKLYNEDEPIEANYWVNN